MWFLYTILIILLTSNTGWGSSEKFTIVEPIDKSIFETESITLVIKLNSPEIEAIDIKNNNKILSLPAGKGEQFLGWIIKLNYGPNKIVVSAKINKKVVESKKITVFYRSDISVEFSDSPPGFRKRPFHQQKRESICKSCHKMELTEENMEPENPEDSMCYQCHKRIVNYSNVHGPVAVWDCLVCHDKDSKPTKYVPQEPYSELCFTCHEESNEEWSKMEYIHGPTATGKCTICHNPHASDNIFWLRKPIWNLCVSCHEEKASGRHVIVGFVASNTHPTKGKPDPTRKGRELTCSSCHNPHASNSVNLFNYGVTSRFSLCQICHRK